MQLYHRGQGVNRFQTRERGADTAVPRELNNSAGLGQRSTRDKQAHAMGYTGPWHAAPCTEEAGAR